MKGQVTLTTAIVLVLSFVIAVYWYNNASNFKLLGAGLIILIAFLITPKSNKKAKTYTPGSI